MVRVATVLVLSSLCLLAALVFLALQEELALRKVKAKVSLTSMQVKNAEEKVVQEKLKIQEINTQLSQLKNTKEALNKKKQQAGDAERETAKNLETCNSEKEQMVKTKTETKEALEKIKADYEKEKKEAEDVIKGLKQQVLDRDKAVCAYVDNKSEEGRKLCNIPEAPQ